LRIASLDPATTAIVVIDVQVGVFETDPGPFDKEGVLARINEVIAAAHAASASVIFLQHDGDVRGKWLLPLTGDWELHPSLYIEGDDRVIRKTACDGFYRSALDDHLRGKAIETLVIAGYATDFCVDTTIRSAASREYNVIVVADAHTTKDRPVLEAAQIVKHHQWVWSNLICPKGVSLLSAADTVRSLAAGT
jgi:nicotinamidase-related amidase